MTLTGVDKDIYSYLNLDDPKSFLLFAGAGSGKTRTLVEVLQAIREHEIDRFIRLGHRIAVITYTNAACEEIKHRLKYDPIFSVSTIHSFIWQMIQPFTNDIKSWLEADLEKHIDDLADKLSRSRDRTNRTAVQNARSMESKKKRLAQLKFVQSFTYSATSTKITKGSLTHSDVINIGTEFLSRPLFQQMLVNKFPILLIDESQDTNKDLMNAFIEMQQNHSNRFSLGLFGDLMQRIYSGGKEDLATSLPDNWETPEKIINYRCPHRVIKLINKIRSEDDHKAQISKADAEEGFVRLFLIQPSTTSKFEIEADIREKMKDITLDDGWRETHKVKTLTLEHAMAASRGAFDEFFLPLSVVDSLRDSLLNGTSSTFRFCTHQVLPLVDAVRENNDFEIMRIIKTYSHLITHENAKFINDPIPFLSVINDSVKQLKELLKNDVTLRDTLHLIEKHQLLIVPDNLKDLLVVSKVESGEEMELSENQRGWDLALNAKLSHVDNYSKYVAEELGFTTHQGVKGLEFERVMAIIDDDDSKGFMFKYDKLFGAVELSATDRKNEDEGRDSVLSRTRRLLYVICSRAEKSLAVVAYSQNVHAVKRRVIDAGWFEEDEVLIM